MFRYVFFVCIVFWSSYSVAEKSELYVGIGYHHSDYDVLSLKSSSPSMGLIVGLSLTEFFAVEARFSRGVKNGSGSILGGLLEFDIEMESLASLFLKGEYGLSEKLSVYGLAGYSSVQFDIVEREFERFSRAVSEEALSYGVGASYALTNSVALNFDSVQYLNTDDVSYIGTSFSVSKSF